MALKRLFKESLIYGVGSYLSKFISAFLLPLYTYVLRPEDYGTLDLLGPITIISTFLIVSGADSALGYYFYNKDFQNEKKQIISSAFLLRITFSLVAFVVIFFSSNMLSNLIYGRDYSTFVIISGMTIVFTANYSFTTDLLRLEQRSVLYSIVTSSGVILNILLSIYFVLVARKGVYGALMAGALSYGSLFVFSVIYVFRRYGNRFSFKWAKDILSYGSPLIATGVAIWVLGATDRYFLAHYQGLDVNGIYAVGIKLASIIGMVAGAIQLAWGPYALGIQYDENARDIYSKVFILFAILNTIVVFCISMFAIDLLKVFTQPAYYSAKAVVPFLCFSSVISSAYFIISIGMNITKRLQHTVWIYISAAALNIGLNFLLTPRLGAVGAAFSIMVANFTVFILTYVVSQRNYKIDFKFSNVLVILIPAALIIISAYYFDFKIVVRSILAAVFLIVASIYLYRNFRNWDEFKRLTARIRRLAGRAPAIDIEKLEQH